MKELLSKDNRSYLMGVSILWIIGLHFYMYSAYPENSIWGFLFAKGYLGVDVFLFLSAYGLCFSYNSNTLPCFYKRRLLRLYPMYLLFAIATVLVFGKTYTESRIELVLYQCTGVASFRQTDFEWYVPALIVIYALFPVIYKCTDWIYRNFKQGLILLAVLLSLISPIISKVLFPMFASRLSIIVLGIATYFSLRNGDNKFLYVMYALCALFAILFKQGKGPDWSLMIPGLLCLLSLGPVSMPLNNVFSFLGKHSLELYLSQSFALNQFFLKSEIDYVHKCLISIAIIVMGAFFLYFFQELATGRLWHK